jgi:hypothetical protein
MARPGRFWLCLVGGLFLVAATGAMYWWDQHLAVSESSDIAAAPVLMDDAQREYIWTIEHHGLLLAKQGFGALGKALAQHDRTALTSIFAKNFSGDLLGETHSVHADTAYAEVVRLQPTSGRRQGVLRGPFIDMLLGYRDRFHSSPKVQFALMSFAPVKEGNLNGLWEGTGQLRLAGDTGHGNPGEIILTLRYGTVLPTKPHLRAPGWLRYATVEQAQIAVAKHGPLMHEVTKDWGIDINRLHDNWRGPRTSPLTNTGGVYLCDYNRDGILDMLVTDVNGITLYQGRLDGGHFQFVDVTEAVGLPTAWNPGQGQQLNAFVDLDGDGWDDLILGGTVYHNEARPGAPGGRGFRDYSLMTNLHLPADASGISVADYDGDGRLDLYVTRPGHGKADSWLSGTSGEPERGNLLLRNLGNWHFEDVTAQTGVAAGNRSAFAAVWLDANNDGRPDLYVINEFGNGLLFINQPDHTFIAKPLTDQPTDFGSMGVTCGDIDNDGNIDLYVGNMYSKAGRRVIGNVRPDTYPDSVMNKVRSLVNGSQLWRNRGGLHFDPEGQALQVNGCGWAYGPALVDLDNDGFLDIYATCGFISQSRTEPDG